MLSLVDYAGSDEDEEEDIGETSGEKCISAEIILNPRKSLKSGNKDEKHKNNGQVIIENDPEITEQISPMLTNLPPTIRPGNVHVPEEKELDELVKQKDWEVKLAKKAQKKRKHHHHHHHRHHHINNKKQRDDTSGNRGEMVIPGKEKIVIQAFGELKGLTDDKNGNKFDEQSDHPVVASSSINLLSMLPQPRNTSKGSRNANIFLPSSLSSTKNGIPLQVPVAKEISNQTKPVREECDDDSDDDYDSSDFFGLKATNDLPQLLDTASALGNSRDKHFEEMERKSVADAGIDVPVSLSDSGCEYDASTSSTTSGTIDDSQALYMIYSRDVSHQGGTVSNAAEVLENMVDVNVDQVLGPNVQATLLKNLHNKSLAEATLSHLANIPKSKGAVNMVARRKHQITYLASVAVAREEQLAEQWSENRHNKRTSARKYGF